MHKRLILFTLILLGVTDSFSQTEFEAGGYNTKRIENEYKLSVPDKIIDSLWSYLNNRYNNSNLFLKEFDSSFVIKTDEDLFIDQYFDNKNWDLIKGKNGIRHRIRYVLTNPNSKKNGKELVQIKINSIDSNKLDRAEFKYPVIKSIKDSNNKEIDTTKVYNLIKPNNKDEFYEKLAEYNIDANEVYASIKVEQKRKRIYIYQDTVPFSTITMDYIICSFIDKKASFTELELELNEIAYTESNNEKKSFMEKINETVKKDITTKFPEIIQDQTPKYNKSFNYLGLNYDTKLVTQKENFIHKYYKYFVFAFVLTLLLFIIRKRLARKSA